MKVRFNPKREGNGFPDAPTGTPQSLGERGGLWAVAEVHFWAQGVWRVRASRGHGLVLFDIYWDGSDWIVTEVRYE